MKTDSNHAEWIVGRKIKDVSFVEKNGNLISFFITFDDNTTLNIEPFEREHALWLYPEKSPVPVEAAPPEERGDIEHHKNVGI